MELQIARQIIDTLAQGVHPVTGEVMPDDSPYNAPPVIRALHAVARALEGLPDLPAAAAPDHLARPRPSAPANAGKPWSPDDDAILAAGFDGGTEQRQLADTLGRTRFGIEQRLIKLGKLPTPTGGGRFAIGAGAGAG